MTATTDTEHCTAVAAWQRRLGLTDRRAAEMLGMTLAGYQRNKAGRRPKSVKGGSAFSPSRALLLACAAIEAGIEPIS